MFFCAECEAIFQPLLAEVKEAEHTGAPTPRQVNEAVSVEAEYVAPIPVKADWSSFDSETLDTPESDVTPSRLINATRLAPAVSLEAPMRTLPAVEPIVVLNVKTIVRSKTLIVTVSPSV